MRPGYRVGTRDDCPGIAYGVKRARYLNHGTQNIIARIYRCKIGSRVVGICVYPVGSVVIGNCACVTNSHPAQARIERIVLVRSIAGYRIQAGRHWRDFGTPGNAVVAGKDRAAGANGGKQTGGTDRGIIPAGRQARITYTVNIMENKIRISRLGKRRRIKCPVAAVTRVVRRRVDLRAACSARPAIDTAIGYKIIWQIIDQAAHVKRGRGAGSCVCVVQPRPVESRDTGIGRRKQPVIDAGNRHPLNLDSAVSRGGRHT